LAIDLPTRLASSDATRAPSVTGAANGSERLQTACDGPNGSARLKVAQNGDLRTTAHNGSKRTQEAQNGSNWPRGSNTAQPSSGRLKTAQDDSKWRAHGRNGPNRPQTARLTRAQIENAQKFTQGLRTSQTGSKLPTSYETWFQTSKSRPHKAWDSSDGIPQLSTASIYSSNLTPAQNGAKRLRTAQNGAKTA